MRIENTNTNPILFSGSPASTARPASKTLLNGLQDTFHRSAKKMSLRNIRHSTLARAAYLFSGFAPVAVGLLSPLLLHIQYKKQPSVTPKERKMGVEQEVATQTVNSALHLMSYFGLVALTRKYLKAKGLDKVLGPKNQDLIKVMAGNIGGFIGSAIIRPILGSTILVKYRNRKKEQAKTTLAANPQTIPPDIAKLNPYLRIHMSQSSKQTMPFIAIQHKMASKQAVQMQGQRVSPFSRFN